MKTTSLVIAIALAVGVASLAKAADEKDSRQQQPAKKVQAEKAKKAPDEGTPLTGSLIKRGYHRAGQITDSSSQVLVLDRDAIERSGASDLKQVLIRRGIH